MDKPTDIEFALDVLDERITNWDTGKAPYKWNGIGPDYSNVFAFDCEMVYTSIPGDIKVDNFRINNLTSYKQPKISGLIPNNTGGPRTIDDYNVGDVVRYNTKDYIKINRLYQSPLNFLDTSVWKPIKLGESIPGDDAESLVEFFGRNKFSKDGNDINPNKITQSVLDEANTRLDSLQITQTVAQTCIVDWNGHVIYNKYVRLDPKDIIWTAKKYSGIRQNFFTDHIIIENGIAKKIDDSNFVTLDDMKKEFDRLFSIPDVKIIGHSIIASDFPKLHYDITAKMFNIRDTADFFPKEVKRTITVTKTNWHGLSSSDVKEDKIFLEKFRAQDLCKNLLFKDIQSSGNGHDPSEDARGALALYKYSLKVWEKKIKETGNWNVKVSRIERIKQQIELLSIYTNKLNKLKTLDNFFYNKLIDQIVRLLKIDCDVDNSKPKTTP